MEIDDKVKIYYDDIEKFHGGVSISYNSNIQHYQQFMFSEWLRL